MNNVFLMNKRKQNLCIFLELNTHITHIFEGRKNAVSKHWREVEPHFSAVTLDVMRSSRCRRHDVAMVILYRI